ncbi:hypothetical protein PtB15_8B576 [Puccinia triticina]|nr:hypothetical protein PtB15_8B576 [Puccinia triticina]
MAPIGRSNSVKRRRMSLADERSLLKTPLPHHLAPGSPDTRSGAASAADPISPLVIGFTPPQEPTAIQQVANTIKLREEQKRLIEHRRNSFAGLNSFSFTNSHTRSPNPPAQNSSPRTLRTNPPPARSSFSNSSTAHNGLMKLLSHPSLSNPTPSASAHSSQQSSYDAPPPVVNLPSIDEAATAAARKPPSNRLRQPPPAGQPAPINHDPHPDPMPSPETVDGSSPTEPSHIGSSVADRRGQVVREKVKNMALAPQAFRPQLLLQPSVQSAPIRSGFLQATAPNGEVVTTPLIARTNLAGGAGPSSGAHPSEFNPTNASSLNQSSRLNHASIGPGPSTAYPNLGGPEGAYRQGIERRMTMHGGALMQVPTLSHLLSGSNNPLAHSQPCPGRGRPLGKSAHPAQGHQTQSIPLVPGPPNHPIPSPYPPNHHYQAQQQQQHSHRSHGTDGPRTATFQDPPPGSARLRGSISGGGGGGMGSSSSSSGGGGIPSKQMFLQLFESFYDSLSDSKVLQNNLEEQIRRSAQLLNSLQQSAGVFEAILDDRLAAVQTQSTRELQILENRIDQLEARLSATTPISTIPTTDDDVSGELPDHADDKAHPSGPNESPKIPLSTQNSSATSTSHTSTGGPRSRTGLEESRTAG